MIKMEEKQIKREIEKVFRFMIPKEEHKEHIDEYLDDCRTEIMKIFELGKKEGRIELKREIWKKKK